MITLTGLPGYGCASTASGTAAQAAAKRIPFQMRIAVLLSF